MKKIIENWDEELGLAVCIIEDNNKVYQGTAQCHPDDIDMKSKLTGQTIAMMRAELDSLIQQRDTELKPGLAALKQLYYSINKSRYFDKKHYEAQMLYRQIRMKEDDIATINEMIKQRKEELKNYISDKDKFYKLIRKKRQDETI